VLCQGIDVEEVLHATVLGPEHHHGVDFLCDRRFGPIGAEAWFWQVEQAWILEPVWLWRGRIADADVHLHAEPRRTQVSGERDACATVRVLLADRCHADRLWIEIDTVRLHIDGADRAEHLGQRFFREVPKA